HGPHLVPLVLQELPERGANSLLVIGHENPSAHRTSLYRVMEPRAMRTSAMYGGTVSGSALSAIPAGRSPRSIFRSNRGIAARGTETSPTFSASTRYSARPGRTTS